MFTLDNAPIGTLVGCKYTYHKGEIGTFSNLSSDTTDGRKITGNEFFDNSFFAVGSNRDLSMIECYDNGVTFATEKTLETETTYLTEVTKETTKDYVNVNNYKKVIDIGVGDNAITILAVPKDTIVLSEMMEVRYNGLSSISINSTGLLDLYIGILDADSGKVLVPKYQNNGTDPDTGDPVQEVVWDDSITIDTVLSAIDQDDITTFRDSLANYAEVVSHLTAADYAKSGMGKNIEFIIVGSIPLVNPDTNEEYSDDDLLGVQHFFDVVVYYDGAGLETGVIEQNFNFVYCGRTNDGKARLIADRVIQTDISFETLALNNLVYPSSRFPVEIENSDIEGTFTVGMPTSKINDEATDNGDWDLYIANDDIVDMSPKGKLESDDKWHTDIGSYVAAFSTQFFTDKLIIARGLGPIGQRSSFLKYSVTYDGMDVGWRPILYITDEVYRTKSSAPALPVVNTITDLEPFKNCIEVEYSADTEGEFGTFDNLGNAGKSYLNTYGDKTADGTLAFICVGEDPDTGGKILMADRIPQVGLPYMTWGDNDYIYLGGAKFKPSLPTTTMSSDNTTLYPEVEPISISEGLYNQWIKATADANFGLTIEDIWHTNEVLTWTSTEAISTSGRKTYYLRGKKDHEDTEIKQRVGYHAFTYPNVGVRLVLTQIPGTHVENLKVSTQVGYENDLNTELITVSANCINDRNAKVGWYLRLKDDGTALTATDTDSKFISVTSLNLNSDPTLQSTKAGTTTIELVDENENVIEEFELDRDMLHRLETRREFGSLFQDQNVRGSKFTNTQRGNVVPTKSFNMTPQPITVNNQQISYISIDPNFTKITI